MSVIGLIGGISPQSTLDYYKYINTITNSNLGGHHSAKILMVSLNFEEIVQGIFSNDWGSVEKIMLDASMVLQKNSVDVLAFCSNTLYRTYDCVKESLTIPIIHILDPVIDYIDKYKLKKIGIIGTKFTLEEKFYIKYLQSKTNELEIVLPNLEDRLLLNQIIFDELCKGIISTKSRNKVEIIINSLTKQGAEVVILGCTELPLLFNADAYTKLPMLDTVKLHSEFIVNYFQ